MIKVPLPEKFGEIFEPYRYKVFYGGRGSGKSTSVAIALIILSLNKNIRILCVREFMNSIKESVHKLICDQIERLGLQQYFTITDHYITNIVGSEFIFKGIRNNPTSIKSMEGIDIVWGEEGQTISNTSLDILIPTIRKPNSEIWLTFNPTYEDDPVYQRFVVSTPPNTIVQKINFDDNPWFPDVLRDEMEYCRSVDYDSYVHIWEGECIKHSDAIIFNKKWKVDVFTPNTKWYGPFYGLDFGFAQDPTALVMCYVYDNILYIYREVFGVGIDIDRLPTFLTNNDTDCHKYTIRADNSRPETISYLKQHGLKGTVSCKKWKGCIEDGISFIRAFKDIVIHPDCKNIINEFKHYTYKVDKLTNDILPDIVPGYDHGIDALRYALEPMITNRRPGTLHII